MATRETAKEVLFITIGADIYMFGFVYLNITNRPTEGGVSGITSILRALFGIDPAYTTLLINIPSTLLGGKILGKRSLAHTVLGTLSLSFSLRIWQWAPLEINLQHDLLIASLLVGLVAGVGNGIVYRMGGATGGSDIVARILEQNYDISMGRSLLAFNIIILLVSLTYTDSKHTTYTLVVSYVFSRAADPTLDDECSIKGLPVISNKSDEITPLLMAGLQRDVTSLSGGDTFSGNLKKIIYMIVNSNELTEAKRIVHETDEKAFLSAINVHEMGGQGLTYLKSQTRLLKKL